MPWLSKEPEVNGHWAGAKLAINVADLTRLPEAIRPMLLGGKISRSSEIVRAEPDRGDGAAVVFDCDLLTAATVADVVRAHDRRAGEPPTRVYVRRNVAWNRLVGDSILTVVEGGKAKLNPRVFGNGAEVEHVVEVAAPPSRGRVEL